MEYRMTLSVDFGNGESFDQKFSSNEDDNLGLLGIMKDIPYITALVKNQVQNVQNAENTENIFFEIKNRGFFGNFDQWLENYPQDRIYILDKLNSTLCDMKYMLNAELIRDYSEEKEELPKDIEHKILGYLYDRFHWKGVDESELEWLAEILEFSDIYAENTPIVSEFLIFLKLIEKYGKSFKKYWWLYLILLNCPSDFFDRYDMDWRNSSRLPEWGGRFSSLCRTIDFYYSVLQRNLTRPMYEFRYVSSFDSDGLYKISEVKELVDALRNISQKIPEAGRYISGISDSENTLPPKGGRNGGGKGSGCFAILIDGSERYASLSGMNLKLLKNIADMLRNLKKYEYIFYKANKFYRYYYTSRKYITYGKLLNYLHKTTLKPNDYNRMFSCCERKFFASKQFNMYIPNRFKNYTLYIRKEPCYMCRLAIEDLKSYSCTFDLNFSEIGKEMDIKEKKKYNDIAKEVAGILPPSHKKT